jgi:hypothetical protein
VSDKRAFNYEHPRSVGEEMPSHYNTVDVPHVLALLRTFDRFFDNVIENDERFNDHYNDLYDAYLTMIERELQPYALDFAISLINLEDQLAKEKTNLRRTYRGTEAHPHLTFVPTVTRQHGEQFARAWDKDSRTSGALTDASAKARIMTWPDNEREQTRYHAIEHEIVRRVFEELHDTIVNTYVRVANDILTRERQA